MLNLKHTLNTLSDDSRNLYTKSHYGQCHISPFSFSPLAYLNLPIICYNVFLPILPSLVRSCVRNSQAGNEQQMVFQEEPSATGQSDCLAVRKLELWRLAWDGRQYHQQLPNKHCFQKGDVIITIAKPRHCSNFYITEKSQLISTYTLRNNCLSRAMLFCFLNDDSIFNSH